MRKDYLPNFSLRYPSSVSVQFSEDMDVLERYYGKQTFTLYALFARVPGKKVWPRTLFLTLGIILLSLGTIFQILKLVLEKFKFQIIIELLPTTAATLMTLFYLPYAYRTDKEYEQILSIMLNDLKEEKTDEEKAIKRRYADGAKLFVNTYSVVLVGTLCGLSISGFIPRLLDVLVPLNRSREIHLIASGEIFIDQQKYFYHIYFAESCSVCVICTVIGISESMAVIIGQHICGMFAVIGFALLIAAFYDIPLTVILVGSFCTLTVSLVQVTDPQLISIKMVIYTGGQFFQLFLVSYMGQNVTDMSVQLSENAYFARWDACPPSVRTTLSMIIMRSSKPCLVVARSMYTLSIESFMSIIQLITSFYMVLRQAQ